MYSAGSAQHESNSSVHFVLSNEPKMNSIVYVVSKPHHERGLSAIASYLFYWFMIRVHQ